MNLVKKVLNVSCSWFERVLACDSHVYLDDIIIWSDNIQEHIKNVRTILEALEAAKLYCNPN